MLVAIEAVRGATTDDLALGRARAALGVTAETLAAVCRDRSASPEAIAAARRRISDAYASFAGLMLQIRTARCR